MTIPSSDEKSLGDGSLDFDEGDLFELAARSNDKPSLKSTWDEDVPTSWTMTTHKTK